MKGSMTMENDDLQFSDYALLSKIYFFDGLNDINLYVEDVDSQYFYETIFKRLLGDRYNIQTIFPCGGKPAVKEMFYERGHFTDGIKNVYVVDGDFDRLLFAEDMIDDPQFVYLKMYNIESYLINEHGLCNLVKSKLKCMDIEVYERLNYAQWYHRIIAEAKELFLCYCCIQKCSLGIPNVSRSHYEFIDDKTGFERNDGAFEKYKKSLYDVYPDAEQEINVIKQDFESRFGKHYEILICGKFLLSSLHSYLYTIVHKSIPADELLWCLVNSFDVSKLEYVKEACLASS